MNIHERFFRDTAHGFVAWAFATVLTATVLAGAGTHLLAAASAGAIPAAGAGAAQAAGDQSTNNSGDVYADRSVAGRAANRRPGRWSFDRPGGRARGTFRLIGPATRKGGDVSADDRAYAARVIAARTGISQAEAEQRVNQTIAQRRTRLTGPAGPPLSSPSGSPFRCLPAR